MVSIHMIYWICVGILGAWMGWRTTADDPARVADVARAVGVALLWCFAAQVILALAYLGAGTDGAVLQTPMLPLTLAAVAATIWVPCVVIMALMRNARERRT